MKALKYGLTLVLGLGMLGCGAQAFAQASGQTQEVTPEHPVSLSDNQNVVDSSMQMNEIGGIIQEEGTASRGVAQPKVVDELVVKKEYNQAVAEFEKFIKTTPASPCDLAYLRVTFYERMMEEDAQNKANYQAECDLSIQFLESKCQKMPELYILKSRLDTDQSPEAMVKWMDKAIEVNANYGTLYIMRGDALWLMGETEKACADYKKAKELQDPVGTGNYDALCKTL